ncbi:hypothetical protein [Actinomadura roseirufa]|uniref:hypothetical protein n=1 Tax=Actinomadura roseirufa TaxID=2094049 RepID=UPI0010410B2D|nr:hypothetical protein [Actinomadura roseirufa]
MALGPQLGYMSGQITTTRVLPPSEAGEPRIEMSYEARGRVVDQDTAELGTYVSVLGQDGKLYGEGQGLTMSPDGATARWTGAGVGTLRDDGSASFRGALYYRTTSEKFSRLNGIALVNESESDADGKYEVKFYEWS